MRLVKQSWAKLVGQRVMSPNIGALISTYSATGVLYAPLTLVGVATTIYGLWGADIIRAWFPWFTFYHLLGGLFVVILLMMVVFYKVVIPSSYAFQVQQQYKHQNPIVDDLQAIKRKQDTIDGKLNDVDDKLVKIEKALNDLIVGKKNTG